MIYNMKLITKKRGIPVGTENLNENLTSKFET